MILSYQNIMQFDLVGLCLNFLSLSTYYEQYANLDKNVPTLINMSSILIL